MFGNRGATLERADAWARQRPWLSDSLLAVVLAGLVAPISFPLVEAPDLDRGSEIALWCLLGALHVAVAFR